VGVAEEEARAVAARGAEVLAGVQAVVAGEGAKAGCKVERRRLHQS